MNDQFMPCGLEDDRLYDQADAISAAHAQRVEDYADNLMSECVKLSGANKVNTQFDVYDGDLLPKLMNEIACWTGSTESAAVQMRKLHNLLASQFSEVAEREVQA